MVNSFDKFNGNNKKIILGYNEKSKKICKLLECVVIGILIILLIFVNICWNGKLLERIIFNFNFVIFILLQIVIILYTNQKVEIESSIITYTNLFNKKKEIGNISDITSFCSSISDVIVFKNDKKFFSFPINGGSDNNEFYNYLKDNYNNSIFIKGSKVIEIVMYLFAMIIFIGVPLEEYTKYSIIFYIIGVLLVFYGIDENVKNLQIVNDQIIYKRLFIKRKMNLNDLTKLEYKKITDSGRYKPVFTTYIITGFNNNSKCFKMNNVTPENLKSIKNIAKKYKIKIIKK